MAASGQDERAPSGGRTPAPADAPGTRRFWLCADDYGLSPGVNRAILELIARGRLNATSAMVVAPSFSRAAARELLDLVQTNGRPALGLHLTLTAPFRPLTPFAPVAEGGAFLPIASMLVRAFWPGFDPALAAREVTAQIDAFIAAFGRPPDYVDGHHHVHLLPGIGAAALAATKRANPDAWMRQCGQARPFRARLRDIKGVLIDLLSRRFRAQAKTIGVRTNPAFAGTYRFRSDASFAARFPGFLDALPEGGVVMCHPGFVDRELERLDPLTTPREKEFAFFASDDFPALLAARGFALA